MHRQTYYWIYLLMNSHEYEKNYVGIKDIFTNAMLSLTFYKFSSFSLLLTLIFLISFGHWKP